MSLKKSLSDNLNFYKQIYNHFAKCKVDLSKILQITKEMYVKLLSIKETNYNLGIYHLKNKNYSDAILRFKLIRLIDKEHEVAVFYLGKAYYLNDNKYKAANCLNEYLNMSIPDKKLKSEARKILKDIS